MNTDELLTRKLLLCSRLVSFCNVNYFFRDNQASITHTFSTKHFHILIINAQLRDIIVEEFGRNTKNLGRWKNKYGMEFYGVVYYM